jgi:hypothetical protein
MAMKAAAVRCQGVVVYGGNAKGLGSGALGGFGIYAQGGTNDDGTSALAGQFEEMCWSMVV